MDDAYGQKPCTLCHQPKDLLIRLVLILWSSLSKSLALLVCTVPELLIQLSGLCISKHVYAFYPKKADEIYGLAHR